jgi:hypothetical protein
VGFESGFGTGRERIDISVDIFGCEQGESRKRVEGKVSLKPVRKFIPVGSSEVVTRGRGVMLKRNGKRAGDEGVVRSMSREGDTFLEEVS